MSTDNDLSLKPLVFGHWLKPIDLCPRWVKIRIAGFAVLVQCIVQVYEYSVLVQVQ